MTSHPLRTRRREPISATHGETHNLQPHLDGLGLDRLHERVVSNMDECTCEVFPATNNILDAR